MATRDERPVLLHIDRDSDEPLYHQVYAQLRHAIRKGVLKEGDRLPSIRSACSDLGVSHITVEKGYLQLAVEGYVRNVPRSGYVVEKVDVEFFDQRSPDNHRAIEAIVSEWRDVSWRMSGFSDAPRYDFSYYNLAPGSFPVRTWGRLAGEALLSLGPGAMERYPVPFQTTSLQVALASYLQRTRGVSCSPQQVVVTAGSEAAMLSLLQLFDARTDLVAHEEPGWNVFYQAARRTGFTVVPLPVDKGKGGLFRGARHPEPAPSVLHAVPPVPHGQAHAA